MEARLRLRQVDQVLRNAFFSSASLNHFAITAAALQGVLQIRGLRRGKIVDEPATWSVSISGRSE